MSHLPELNLLDGDEIERERCPWCGTPGLLVGRAGGPHGLAVRQPPDARGRRPRRPDLVPRGHRERKPQRLRRRSDC